jgi:hypothetical protein
LHGDLMSGQQLFTSDQQRWLVIAGRHRPGVSMATAEAEANVVLRQYLADHPRWPATSGRCRTRAIALVPGARGISPLRRAEVRTALFV